ncbi:MAG: phosphoglucosamine mutase, partial [Leptospiraceae bacterium]|nr:phosphoglucosamine mutase [Leptospiraceae bacterium]
MKPNQSLLVSVSGVRGTIPEGLNLPAILNFTQAFVDLLRPKTIVLGRDSRPSGAYIEKLVEGVLLSKGVNVISIGIVPTPTLKAVVVTTNAAGGIMISASHNPIQWNAFKFVGKKGFFFNQTQMENLQKLYQKEKFSPIKHIPKSTSKFEPSYVHSHIEGVLKRVNIGTIRKRKFKVLLDAVNGGGSL